MFLYKEFFQEFLCKLSTAIFFSNKIVLFMICHQILTCFLSGVCSILHMDILDLIRIVITISKCLKFIIIRYHYSCKSFNFHSSEIDFYKIVVHS